VPAALDKIQQKTALLPDYGLKSETAGTAAEGHNSETVMDSGRTAAGLVGGILTLLTAGLIGWVLNRHKKRSRT